MLIKLSKLFFTLLVMYYGWFQIVFFQIPNMLLVLGACMMGCIFIHAYKNKVSILKCFTAEIIMWIIFAVTSLAFGIFIARNPGILISEVVTFIEFLIMMYGIIYISAYDKSIEFFVTFYIMFAAIRALTTLFYGVEYGSGRISMGPNNNPNELGISLAIGVCFILYKLDLKKFWSMFLSFVGIFLFVYVVLLTGSRKSFLSIALIIVYWLVFVAFKEGGRSKLNGLIMFVLLAIIGYSALNVMLKDSVLILRLYDLFRSGDKTRKGMYKAAIELFMQNPVFGIGFNNYRILSGYGTYSHSTYAEALACTGIVGAFLYFYPYGILLMKYKKLFLNRDVSYLLMKQFRIMTGLFCVLLFLGIGIIHFYEMSSSIAFGIIVAFSYINKEYINASKTFSHN